MSTTYTTNYHLGKQTDTSDNFNMSVITDNMDIIDTQMKSNENNISLLYNSAPLIPTIYDNKQCILTGLTDNTNFAVYQYEIPSYIPSLRIVTNTFGNGYIIFTNSAANETFDSSEIYHYPTVNGRFPSSTTVDIELETHSKKYVYVSLYKASGIIPAVTRCYIDNTSATLAMFEKIGVIGDSYASGQIYTDGTPTNYYNLSWGQIMARRNGATCINFSRGGMTTKSWLSDTDKGLSFMQSSDAQSLYIIALGINDVTEIINNRYTLGTIADFDLDNYTTSPDTFFGNMSKIIGYIMAKSPNCKIILSTMAANTTGTQTSINNAIVACGTKGNIPVIKQYENAFFNSSYYTNGMVSSHPTAPVYSGMAVAIEELINKCIYNNYTYFSDYKWS